MLVVSFRLMYLASPLFDLDDSAARASSPKVKGRRKTPEPESRTPSYSPMTPCCDGGGPARAARRRPGRVVAPALDLGDTSIVSGPGSIEFDLNLKA